MVSLEVAGASKPTTVNLVPNQARGMAGWLLQECVNNEFGGFMTYGIARMLDYISNPTTVLTQPFRTIIVPLIFEFPRNAY